MSPGDDRLDGVDALALLECIHECHACRSRETFRNLFPKIQALFAFDHALALVGRLDGGLALTVDGVNTSFPEAWIRAYLATNSLTRDALVKRNFATHATQYWSETGPVLARPNALALCLDFGMRHGWVAGQEPLFSGRNSSMFCFAGTTVRPDRRADAVLVRLLPHLHLALFLAIRGTSPNRPPAALSLREKEVLDWLKEGKSSWEISSILGIRERTVNFHVANVMSKLGASNRVQAVALALDRGLITLD
jgi:DNA-binding CsgD family transcriptional regulator